MVFYDLFHAICGPSASFAAHQHLLRSSRARLRPVHSLYGPSRACLQPIRAILRLFCACLQPIRAFYGFPTPVYGHSAPFTALPRPQKSASHPSRHRLISQTIPQGERRALPAPAQGTYPLGIPFWKPPLSLPSLRPQNAAGGKPLLVGLPPSIPAFALFGTKRSAQAPYSWGLGA